MLKFNYVGGSDESSITVAAIVDGELKMFAADHNHPNFNAIVERVVVEQSEDESVLDLFDIARAVSRRFERLSERVSVANGQLFLDGEVVDNALTQQVMRFLNEGVEDWRPLIKFYEKVLANPNEHSREQLYRWLNDRDFTITDQGDIVGYKGVKRTADGFESITAGRETVIVNGREEIGHIPNPIGGIVEMPRGTVEFNPSVACSVGLHVATFHYASTWAGDYPVLEVHVNPRDVVSVPTDSGDEKMRVCRYVVVKEVDVAHNVPVVSSYDRADDEDWCPDCEHDFNYCVCDDRSY